MQQLEAEDEADDESQDVESQNMDDDSSSSSGEGGEQAGKLARIGSGDDSPPQAPGRNSSTGASSPPASVPR